MKKSVSVTTDQFTIPEREQVISRAARQLKVKRERIKAVVLTKRSVDARRGELKVLWQFSVFVDEEPETLKTGLPVENVPDTAPTVIIVGSGPAGLFAALRLLEQGIRPVIVEQGSDVATRRRQIARISTAGLIDQRSNYCFGSGGAGTFSDGKLYTRSSKRGDIASVLSILVAHGADRQILTEAHPHIGTDRLGGIITSIIDSIESFGGKVLFDTQVTDLIISSGKTCGVVTSEGEQLHSQAVILACGHSARDLYRLLDRKGIALERKTFAMGVRIEHPRSVIDTIQYHGKDPGLLGAASYTLKAQVEGRGVYSFCMCPGGIIVPSATSADQIVVNGMSPSSRATRWSNAAIIVEITPDDIRENDGPLSGMELQEELEKTTAANGKGQKAPAQRLVDFLAGRVSETLPEVSYTPGVVPSRIDLWLDTHIADRLKEAFLQFDQRMRGFICPEAVLVAIESRSSSPMRILRDPESLESLSVGGLYPAGEGSGYAGGIVSSAMDGQAVASSVARRLSSSMVS